MPKNNTIWMIAGVFILIILLLLLGWFLFIRGEQNLITQTLEGRGFGTNIPQFEGGVGSTNKNIGESLLSGFGFFDNKDNLQTDSDSSKKTVPRLWKLSAIPSSGISFIGTTSPQKIQFVERPSGNIFEAYSIDGSIKRLSNTLIPNVYESFWSGNNKLVMRHLDENGDVATLFGKLVQSATTSSEITIGSFRGEYLEPDITTVATTNENDKIFYIVKTISGSVGITTSGKENDMKRIFDSHISGWRSKFINSESILIYQNASEAIDGSAFILDTQGNKTLLKSNVRGLIISVSKDGESYIYNNIVRGRLSLFAKTKNSEERSIPLSTLAEKCIFDPNNPNIAYCATPRNIPNATLPDAWYRGEIHFSDDWWIINLSDGSVEQLISPESDFGVLIDVLDPVIDKNGEYIIFLDANTRTPWALRIGK
jgi:hypothetical protein